MPSNITSRANTKPRAQSETLAARVIAAVATPPGRGGIGVVRLSGRGALTLCKTLAVDTLPGDAPRPRYAELCNFHAANGDVIDRGLVLYFPAPRSYTGEDVIELHAHGGPVVMAMLLARCLELGAVQARPGEFSERAFLNGKLDLAQAEAVADLIASGTAAAAKSAMQSLQGKFSSRVHALIAELTELRVQVEAAIDFPDDDPDAQQSAGLHRQLNTRLQTLQTQFQSLREAAARGKLLRDGLKVALTGPPNAGKSSLLNALAGQPRAIVSRLPGTTRDVLEHWLDLDGLPVEIVDTAGVRDGANEIEIEGIRRARAAQRAADLVLLVTDDATADAAETDRLVNLLDRETRDDDARAVCIVRNKIDLSGRAPGLAAAGEFNLPAIAVSALTGEGLGALITLLKQRAGFRQNDDNLFIARERHLDALRRASHCLDAARAQTDVGELMAEELAECQRVLGEITGEVAPDELLGMIFSSFCIGK